MYKPIETTAYLVVGIGQNAVVESEKEADVRGRVLELDRLQRPHVPEVVADGGLVRVRVEVVQREQRVEAHAALRERILPDVLLQCWGSILESEGGRSQQRSRNWKTFARRLAWQEGSKRAPTATYARAFKCPR